MYFYIKQLQRGINERFKKKPWSFEQKHVFELYGLGGTG